MKTLQEIKEDINARAITATNNTNKLVADALHNHKMVANAVAVLEEKLPFLVAALGQQGLGVHELTWIKTGINNDFCWGDKDSLSVEIKAVPINGKFKFFTFSGYTASGRSKNRDRCQDKANKLVAAVKSATGLESVNVNECSLEVRGEDCFKRVLMTVWIRPTIVS